MSNEPEGVQDLLEQDAGMSEADVEEEQDQEMTTTNGAAATLPAQKQNGAARSTGAGQGAQQQQQQQQQQGKGVQGTGPKKNGRQQPRFFVLKSKSMFNVDQSVEKGIWATQKHNEEKLNEAFRQKCGVFLIFSVNMSGHFQGYARMQSYVSSNQNAGLWEDTAAVGGTFRVDWKRRFDLPFTATNHLYNPMNEGKPVRIGRDGQEVPADVGRALCQLFDEGADAAGIPPPTRPQGAFGGPGRGRGGGNFGGRFGGPRPPMGPFGMQGGPMGGPMMGMGMNFPMGAGRPPFMVSNGMEAFGGFGGPGFGGGFGPGFGGMQRARPDQMAAFAGPAGMRGPQLPPPTEDTAVVAPARKVTAMMGKPMAAGGRGQAQGSRGRGLAHMEEDYNDADWESGYDQGPGYDRKRDRHYDRHRRRDRRSRSPSPRREKSRRRSRSRSRSRSRERKGLADMSYEQYLEAFEKLQQKARGGGASSGAVNSMMMGVNPVMMAMQAMMSQGMGSMSGMGAMGGMGGGAPVGPRGMMGMGAGGPSMGGMPSGGGGSVGAQISEEEYVRVWEQYSKMMGTPFNPDVVRGWYQQYRQTLGR